MRSLYAEDLSCDFSIGYTSPFHSPERWCTSMETPWKGYQDSCWFHSCPCPYPNTPSILASTTSVPAKRMTPVHITWEGSCTDQLITWITSHAADHHILFHDHSLSISIKPLLGKKPSGKNKKDIFAVIAKHIFEHDADHSQHIYGRSIKISYVCDQSIKYISTTSLIYLAF